MMKLIPDPNAAHWLQEFVPDPDNFDWDNGNISKNIKHGYSVDEIESLFWQKAYIFAGHIVEPAHDEWRGLILGTTDSKRLTALIFT